MKDPITAEQALAGLRAAVDERGRDYVDPHAHLETCRYVSNGEPSCIAATALFIVGIPVEELARWEGSSVRAMEARDGADAFGREGFLTLEATRLLGRAQNVQDRGDTWGRALDVVETHCAERFPHLLEVKP